jgi:hypothetical protein
MPPALASGAIIRNGTAVVIVFTCPNKESLKVLTCPKELNTEKIKSTAKQTFLFKFI